MTDRDPHPRAPGALALSLTGRGIWNGKGEGKREVQSGGERVTQSLIAGRNGTGESMALVKACKTSDLKPGGAIRVNHKPPIAVYRLNDGFYATDDTCTHAEASLAAGDVDLEECAVECPYHGSFFDIKTGHVLSLPASKPLKTYPVKVVDDEVFVEVG
jgi:3-phenylpropionate/trans-cinnamate dioxygenase ferredoxin component